MDSEQSQVKGVQLFDKNKDIRVSHSSRAATMPLVFFTSPEKEWYVLYQKIAKSKEKDLVVFTII